MTYKKIALFGGTFDPIHLGHTKVAASAARYIEADEVILIPAKLSPLKGSFPQASDTDRLAMLSLAIAEEKKFSISRCELDRAAPSFTLDTVKYFLNKYGSETQIYWLIGADNIDDLIQWYEITALLDLCNLATMYRAGCEKPQFKKYESLWGAERIEKLQRNIIPTPLVNISSTEIRNRIAAGLDVSQMLHPAVADYIFKHELYQAKTSK
jgi:nicotinate-nucleotide adenylyltransferase